MAPPLRKIGKRRRVIGQIELPMPNRPPPPPQKDCIVRAQRKNVVRNRRKKRKWAHRRRSLLEEEEAGNGRREQKRFNLITYRFPYKVSFLDWGPFPKKTQQPPTVFRGTGPFISFWSKFSCQAVSPFPPPADSLPLSFGDGTLLLSLPPPGAMSRNRSAQQGNLMLGRQQAKESPNCFTFERRFKGEMRKQIFFKEEKWYLGWFSLSKISCCSLVFAFQVQ